MPSLTQKGGSFANAVALNSSPSPSKALYEAIYVGTAGDVTLWTPDGNKVTYKAAVGYIWQRNRGLFASTATDILGLS